MPGATPAPMTRTITATTATSGTTTGTDDATVSTQTPEGEPVMFELQINGVARGEIIVLFGEDTASTRTGPLWLSAPDFAALGIDAGVLPRAQAGGADYVRLEASPRVTIALDPDALRLSLTFAAELLGRQTIDLSTGADLPPGPALPAHGWVDYDLGLRADRARRVLSADTAFNLAFAGWSLRSEHAFVADGGHVAPFRWRTFAERDWPQAMVRLSLGDLPASRLPFGRSGAVSGVRVARRFDLRPGFSAPPTFAWSGTVDTPTTADIYLDGSLLRSVPIAPGRYDLRELSYFSGLHDVRVVLADAFGARREIVVPHYFSDAPLRRGLHEFEYTLGVPRDATDAAGDPLLTGWHRYGIHDRATVGVGVEATRGYRAWSAESAFVLGPAGTLRALYARSATDDAALGDVGPDDVANAAMAVAAGVTPDSGRALSVDYGFTTGGLSVTLGEWRRSAGFGRLPGSVPILPGLIPTRRTSLGFSTGLPNRQSISVSLGREVREDGATTHQFGLRYSARLFDRVAVGARFTRSRGDAGTTDEAELRFQVDLGRGWSGGASVARAAGSDRQQLGVERGLPGEGGWGLRGTLEREGDSRRAEAMARRDVAFGELALQLRQRQDRSGSGTAIGAQFAGALVLAGGSLRATRPIREGFALVETGGLRDVRVYRNNTYVGRTDDDGRLLLPGIAPYIRTQVRLDDRDIPIEVQLDTVSVDAVARSRIGVAARFRSVRIVSAGGRLRFAGGEGEGGAIASAVLRTVVDGREVRTSTGPDGDFYLDGLAPGEFVLDARNASRHCRAVIRVDADAPAFTELGEVACAPVP